MTVRLRVLTEELGGNPLSRLIQRGEAPESWAVAAPRTVEDWRARFIGARRAESGWLDAIRAAISPAGAAAERLERVAVTGGVIVSTGQQPGLFGGPAYTWSKAISALAIADHLEQSTGIAACPLFWAATDDADFEEARSTAIAVRGGTQILRLEGAPVPGTPMARVALGDIRNLLDGLEGAAGSAAHRPTIDAVRESYTASGATVGSAYVALVRRMLEPLGIPVLDAAHDAVEAAARPLLLRALESAPAIRDALAKRDAELRELGFDPQVESDPHRTLVFGHSRGVKARLPIDSAAAHAHQRLSPNVVLRPVVEAAIMPVACYVAGPAELAYFAQVTAVAAGLGVATPLAVPRWSCTVIEPHVGRVLERLGIEHDQLYDIAAIERRLATDGAPPGALEAIRGWRKAIDDSARDFLKSAKVGDLVPAASVDSVRAAMALRLDRLERRLLAGVKRRDNEAFTDLRTAYGALFPGGIRQERRLNLIPTLARQGDALFGSMLERAREHAASLAPAGHGAGVVTQS